MLGYAENGYRLWDQETGTVINSRDVKFNEVDEKFVTEATFTDTVSNESPNDEDEADDDPLTDNDSEYESAASNSNDDLLPSPTASLPPPPSRPRRKIVPPARFKDYVVDAPKIAHTSLCAVNDIPDNFCAQFLEEVTSDIGDKQ